MQLEKQKGKSTAEQIKGDELNSIQIGIGTYSIRFGMTRQEVAALIGNPDRMERFSYLQDEDARAEDWEYNNDALCLTFTMEENWRLSSIAVRSEKWKINGQSFIGLHQSDFERLVPEDVWGEMQVEDFSSVEYPERKLVSFKGVQLNFWFDDGVVSDIEWGPLWQDENTIAWP